MYIGFIILASFSVFSLQALRICPRTESVCFSRLLLQALILLLGLVDLTMSCATELKPEAKFIENQTNPVRGQTLNITAKEAAHFGKQIFCNECSGQKEKLVWWNAGEQFPSLGIGHCIWYPENKEGPFEETFPALMTFLKAEGAVPPSWLENHPHCPWKTRKEFLDASQNQKKQELQEFLFKTMSLQTFFILKRFELSLQNILKSVSDTKQATLLKHIKNLEQSSLGKFALIDYLHFKGSGLSPTERYQGKGWGLRQVLEEMPNRYDDPSAAFIETATQLLIQRVEHAPKERHEERWLTGWISRLETYRTGSS